MSPWVDGVLLSAVDSALLTDSVIAYSLLDMNQYAKNSLSLTECLFNGTSLLVTSFYSLQRSL